MLKKKDKLTHVIFSNSKLNNLLKISILLKTKKRQKYIKEWILELFDLPQSRIKEQPSWIYSRMLFLYFHTFFSLIFFLYLINLCLFFIASCWLLYFHKFRVYPNLFKEKKNMFETYQHLNILKIDVLLYSIMYQYLTSICLCFLTTSQTNITGNKKVIVSK